MLTAVADQIYSVDVYIFKRLTQLTSFPIVINVGAGAAPAAQINSPTAAVFNYTSASRFLIKCLSGQDAPFAMFMQHSTAIYIISRHVFHAQEKIST